MNALALFSSLRNPRFARLYAAQTISQVGDALTWVGLALLAAQLAGPGQAPAVLAIALTIRVAAFVLLSPLAGVLADRVNRRTVLVTCDFGRMAVLGGMFFVTQVWQIYVLMFVLNALTAFFTPTNQATVPLVVGRDDARPAFALSSATTELLGIVGPGLAGALAAWLGTRTLFAVDAASFLLSGLLILTLPALRATQDGTVDRSTRADLRDGTARLWRDPPIRFALLMELVAALAGAMILTVTVSRVEGGLHLGGAQYGWVMAAYGLGAAAASLAVGLAGKRVPLTRFIAVGALVTSLAILPGNVVPLSGLMAFWLIAGIGQNWVNLPTETLLAERTDEAAQGRVYGAHFAWSHLWWAFAYPVAGFLGTRFPEHAFVIGGGLALVLLAGVWLSHARKISSSISDQARTAP
ncbi:NRE family putative nickel resistance protein-like MFS transporter [Deinococcus metalli]|uniref:MFS transporter n=1 Tax=Deinococcus metalli TaxID=1141878 RepID=A0A7W8KI34_9DEIO|nr:MFS transporter [Deinococcus metalli]MBB5378512.1 NRE family putative nickel resistance protein-like MFS transporter [Deinococcus metalli]GHF58233.1 MFS transporter [Deinococcus metalli]